MPSAPNAFSASENFALGTRRVIVESTIRPRSSLLVCSSATVPPHAATIRITSERALLIDSGRRLTCPVEMTAVLIGPVASTCLASAPSEGDSAEPPDWSRSAELSEFVPRATSAPESDPEPLLTMKAAMPSTATSNRTGTTSRIRSFFMGL